MTIVLFRSQHCILEAQDCLVRLSTRCKVLIVGTFPIGLDANPCELCFFAEIEKKNKVNEKASQKI